MLKEILKAIYTTITGRREGPDDILTSTVLIRIAMPWKFDCSSITFTLHELAPLNSGLSFYNFIRKIQI